MAVRICATRWRARRAPSGSTTSRTGAEMFTVVRSGYTAEKAETDSGWLFPVGDEVHEPGYVHMFTDMFEAMDGDRDPMETFYDGYVINAIPDACWASRRESEALGAGRTL